jgi:hypothetical protein
MIITDMRMESEAAGREVIQAARTAPYHPAVALLSAHSMVDEDWQDGAPDKMLVKPMQTAALLRQLEKLLETHSAKLARLSSAAAPPVKTAARKAATRKSAAKKPAPARQAQKAGRKQAAKTVAKKKK